MLLSVEFDMARWFCLWNSDQNYNKTISCGLVGDTSPGASRV